MKNGLLILFCFMLLSFYSCSDKNNKTETQNSDSTLNAEYDIQSIADYFAEVKQICDADNGKLWGKNLYSPVLFIDRDSRQLYANQQDKENKFVKTGSIFTGTFPEDKNIANSTTELYGMLWTMVAMPLPKDDFERKEVIIHEMFHYLQPELKLDPDMYSNAHMDNMDARILLKLEWLALLKAVQSDDSNEIKASIIDAICFRNYRRSLYSESDSNENRFELHEGLPEYTAFTLVCKDNEEHRQRLLGKKNFNWSQPSYIRSFAYLSGHLYAYLLDQTDVDWKTNLNIDDNLGNLTVNAYNIELPKVINEATIKKSRQKYGYDTIYNVELKIQNTKDSLIADYKSKFIDNPTIKINIINPHVGFNPAQMHTFEDYGTVYDIIRIVDDWGIISVTKNGCLLNNDWSQITIPLIDYTIKGDSVISSDWNIKLNEGYKFTKNGNSYTIK